MITKKILKKTTDEQRDILLRQNKQGNILEFKSNNSIIALIGDLQSGVLTKVIGRDTFIYDTERKQWVNLCK